MMATYQANMPFSNVPVLGADGRVSEVWWRFFLALWNRTGGGSGAQPDQLTIADVLALEDVYAPAVQANTVIQEQIFTPTQRDSVLDMVFAPASNTDYARAAYSLPMPPTSPWTYTASFRQGFYLSGGAVSSFVLQRGPITLPIGNSGADVADQTFVSGVDFTPGVTTSLTLSQAFGAEQRLWVFFDSAYQGDDQFTLSGTTLTFTAPIPVGVSQVYVKGLSLSSAGLGTQLIELSAGDVVNLTYSSAPAVVIIPR